MSGRPRAGPYALAVVVQDEHREPGATAGIRIFEHLPVADRIAEGEVGPPPDHEVNALRLAGVVVIDEELRLLHENRTAVRRILVADGARSADHLLGRDAVDPLRIGADEILPAAGDDICAVADAAEIFEKLDLRLIDEFGVGPFPARVAGLSDPFRDLVAKCVGVHSRERRGDHLDEGLEAEACDRFEIAGQHGAERLDLGELGLRLHERWHAIEAIDELRIDGMLDP